MSVFYTKSRLFYILIISLLLFFVFSNFVFALSWEGFSLVYLSDQLVNNSLRAVLALVISLVLLSFFYSVFRFISESGSNKEQLRKDMLVSVLGVFIIVSIFGIIELVRTLFG